uniref:Uncharacterized protein n=1 Tax=Zooxanthella nutricula TaxID=1333877 RepID=A0A7S2KC98_9DINO
MQGLVDRVKEWQRMSPAHKQSWDNYCIRQGINKFDPSKKDEAFLQGFLDLAASGQIALEETVALPGEASTEKAALIQQVKAYQRQGHAEKQAWWNFCTELGSRDFDPNRHEETVLQDFLSGVANKTIKPDYSGAKGDGWSSKGGGKGNGWDMMSMMFSMMGKGGASGWGGGWDSSNSGWGKSTGYGPVGGSKGRGWAAPY